MPTHKEFATKHLDVRVQAGDEWQCLCPYHEDSNPSFSFNIKKGLFICYACGAKGNTQQLAKHLNVIASSGGEIDMGAIKDKINGLFKPQRQRVILPEWLDVWRFGDEYKDWWRSRGITSTEVLDQFCLGYDHIEHQLIIPVHRPDSRALVSVVRRNLKTSEGKPKYLYEAGFKISENLYGSWQVRTTASVGRPRAVAITEGSIDTLAMWQVGIPSVALLGARVSPTQTMLLKRLDPMQYVVMTDRDTAGRTAAMELQMKLKRSGIIVSEPTVWARGKKDPAELDEEERLEAFDSALYAKC